MIELKRTGNDIYYYYSYVPKRYWEFEEYEDDSKISKKLLDYKDCKKDAVDFFTKQLEEYIIFLSNMVFASNVEEIALVAIPPSDKYAISPIRLSIESISERFDDGKITDFKYLKKLYNCGKLLTRGKTVPSSKNNKKARKFVTHYMSIDFDEDLILGLENVVFILIDDITTTGFTMHVCEEILIDNCIDEDNIYKLVFAETI